VAPAEQALERAAIALEDGSGGIGRFCRGFAVAEPVDRRDQRAIAVARDHRPVARAPV